jgi:hypothetical protein
MSDPLIPQTFTFDITLPTARDRMRMALGDTDPSNPIRYNETYDSMLAYWEDETIATAKMARAFASQFGRDPSSVSIPGGPSVSYASRVPTWLDLAKNLESAIGSLGGSTSSYTASKAVRPGMEPLDNEEYRRRWDDLINGNEV